MKPASIPVSPLPPAALGSRHPRLTLAVVAALSALFVVGHVPWVPETLDGIDSTNFMLAVDRYNPRLHQPHPPGFPVHVALGRVVASAYRAVVSGEHEIGSAATSLRIWSVICGALAMVAMMRVALGIGLSAWRAAFATALLTLCPLFWITSMRPLSDVPGLLFVLISQALALAAYNRGASLSSPGRPRTNSLLDNIDGRWLGAAFVAGLAVGVRVQTTLLTLPLLAVVAWLHIRRAGAGIIPQLLAALLTGVLVWAVPLALTLGGPGEYFRLLTTVAIDDVQGVEMVATRFSPRLVALALMRTFIVPWGSIALGSVVLALTIVGAVALAMRNRRILGLALVMGLPYFVVHLLFQETASIRYALPLVPVTAVLIVGTLKLPQAWVFTPGLAALIGFAATAGVAAATSYGRAESPVARAVEESSREVTHRTQVATLAAHHAVGRAIRGETWPGQILATPVRYEWLEIARYWLDGRRDLVWFLADDRRTDLALIDPTARRLVKSYSWPADTEALLGGIQPLRVSWYEITPPGWFLMKGWALTPETRGVTTRDQQGPGIGGAVGYIRRRAAPAMMLVGGRNLGGPCDTAARIEVLIDGRSRASFTVPTRSPFLKSVALPAGDLAGPGDYTELKVIASDVTPAGRMVDVAIEQFDLQSPGFVVTGFGRGWHMPELDTTSGVSWRWTEDVSELGIEAFGRDVQLTIRGESPLRYFQESPRVMVAAGAIELGSFRPNEDFEWTVTIPAATLAAANGRVTIKVDRWFVPDDVSSNGDHRRLALRIFNVSAATAPTTRTSQ